jgi:hypothetical protein
MKIELETKQAAAEARLGDPAPELHSNDDAEPIRPIPSCS